MDEDALINMVADHEGRMTKFEYDVLDHQTRLEDKFVFGFDKVFGELKALREEMAYINFNFDIRAQKTEEEIAKVRKEFEEKMKDITARHAAYVADNHTWRRKSELRRKDFEEKLALKIAEIKKQLAGAAN